MCTAHIPPRFVCVMGGGGDTGSQTETGLKQVRIRSILTFVFSVYKEGFNNRPTYTQSQY